MEEILEDYELLIKFLSLVEKPKKDISGHNYKYADLHGCMESIQKALDQTGLEVFHDNLHSVEDGVSYLGVATKLIGPSGIIESTSIKVPAPVTIEKGKTAKGVEWEKKFIDPQEVGSVLTYYRRYNLLSLCNLIPEDDDGASASSSYKKNSQAKASSKEEAGEIVIGLGKNKGKKIKEVPVDQLISFTEWASKQPEVKGALKALIENIKVYTGVK